MTAKTPTERQKAHAERKRAAGLREVRSLWAPLELHKAIRAAAAKLIDEHAKESK